jgi:glycosyltransferase involved in cell wall biosynthesis
VPDHVVPTVSVVIPAFNASAWIAETIASVVNQSYSGERLEIVVVDDGSADGTADVAETSLAACAIAHTVLRMPTSKGPSAARNAGWRHARGEWLQFLDADDLLAPSKIAEQMEVAARMAPDVAAVFSPWTRLVQDHGAWVAEIPIHQPVIQSDTLLEVLRTENFLQLGSLLFARPWLDRVGGFTESRRLIEDVELLVRMAIAGGLLQNVPSGVPLSFYRLRADSLSRTSDRAFVEGCIANAQIAERHWTDRDALTPTRRQLLATIYFDGARYMAAHDLEQFGAIVDRIEQLQPGFIPPRPRRLRWLTRLVGYPRAEMLAVRFRQLKRATKLAAHVSER